MKTCNYKRIDGKDKVIDVDIWQYKLNGKHKAL